MKKMDLKVNTVVQLNPHSISNKAFGGCFMIITEPKGFGAQGYVQAIGDMDAPGGQAYYRANWDEMEYIGQAEWVVDRSDNGLD